MTQIKFKDYPPLGAHTSIAGGVYNAIYNGLEIGCDVIQMFSKNQMQWKGKILTDEEIEKFQVAVSETGVLPMTVHDAYLINLGSPQRRTYQTSYKAFVDELQRCEILNVPYLVMHPGSHLGSGEEQGMNKIAQSILKAYEEANIEQTVVLLETTAGQGSNLGYSFEQIKYMIDKSQLNDRIAVCIDTCHIFAAGYDLRTPKVWKETKKIFDEIIGLDKLKIFHVNDSKREFGSKVDRHARIGKGHIGLNGFKHLLNDPQLKEVPMILEIPGGEAAYAEDLQLLRTLKKQKKTQTKIK